jgi:oxygen-independent coproporphyrinogen-3 oxidase
MDINAIRSYLGTHVDLQPGTKIQYGHPSPRFWTPMQLSLEEIASMRQKDRKLFLYLHIQFCPQTDPPACGFCLFAREDFTGYPAVERYLEYLERELKWFAPHFRDEELACVYWGGGTPNLLKPKEYGRIMDWVRSQFRLAPDCEVSLEGVPQLFDKKRIAAMAEAGITRVSIGAQQLKDELIKFSGRNQDAEQVLRSVDLAHEHGMVANVDFICGWFNQNENDLEDDLRMILPHRPESIVIHPLTLQGPSHFSQEKAKLPLPRETCAAFLRGRRFLEENGYWGSSATDYMLKDPPKGPEEVKYLRYYREHMHYDRLGIGYGANSLFSGPPGKPAKTWRNIDQSQAYYESIDQGRLPVLEGFQFNETDLRLLYVVKGLEGTPYLDAANYHKEFGRDLARDFADQWTVLKEMGWLEIRNGTEYRLVDEGIFYVAMIQRCVCNDRNDDLRRRARKANPLQLQVVA